MSALLLALVLMLGVVFHAYALEPSPSATPGLESSVGNDTGDESTNQEKLDELGLAEEDFFITDEVARYIAEFFIRDMAATGNTVWDDDTSIVEIVPMYDATGENIVAYSAELTEGYVTISAYIDMPNIILEWADEGVPIYKSDGLESASAYSFRDNSKIIYLGTLNYFQQEGDNIIDLFDHSKVEDLSAFETNYSYRDLKNVQENVLESIQKERVNDNSEQNSIAPQANDNSYGGYITNPYTYAKNVYGETWKATSDWKNYWESYVRNIATMSALQNTGGQTYYEHCGPVAITNLLKIYGGKHSINSITSKTNAQIFSAVIAASKYYQPPLYVNMKNGGGTNDNTADSLIWESFNDFGVQVETWGPYNAKLSDVQNCLGTNNRLMYLMLNGSSLYGHHAVAAYAYCTITNSSESLKRSFIKICDGKNSSPRYVDVASTVNNKYWEVLFND